MWQFPKAEITASTYMTAITGSIVNTVSVIIKVKAIETFVTLRLSRVMSIDADEPKNQRNLCEEILG